MKLKVAVNCPAKSCYIEMGEIQEFSELRKFLFKKMTCPDCQYKFEITWLSVGKEG